MSTTMTLEPKAAAEPQPDRPLTPLPRSWRSLPRAFVHVARARRNQNAIADSTKTSLTYGETLLRAVALGKALSREWGEAENIGVLLPPTVPGALVNLALALWGKVAVNLNYTAGQENLDAFVKQGNITHVITSRMALRKFGLEPKAELVYVEDVPKKLTKLDKVWAAFVAKAVPEALLSLFLPGMWGKDLDKTATIIFTSGSTGEPKGVMLTHGNLLSNIHQLDSHLDLGDEIVLGILPFFHSFGYLITIWTCLGLGKRVVYHFNPLDARIVGNLCEEHGITLIVTSPTLARTYLRKCDPKQFATVTRFVLGAERLKVDLAEEIQQKLGVSPIEGYGCTETSPIIAASVPEPKRTPDGRMVSGYRLGTVGTPFAGTVIKTIDPDTGADLPRGAEGIVLVKGPQVMKGYLNRPELTAKVLRDGWYTTGDLGFQDADGFLTITGRLSRFSKIGGEMVPHERVENEVLSLATSEHPQAAVTAVPDLKRGERVVVLYKDLGLTPEEMHRRLLAGSLPKLWVPGTEDFIAVEEIPLLGTGKLDLHKLRELALEITGEGQGALRVENVAGG